MDSARSAIEETLNQVKAYLAQESPSSLSEADTKAHFIEPILRALGWQGLGVVTREYYVKNSQEFIDFALKGPNGLVMAIETKKLLSDLADKHAAQLVQYCAIEGIEWAVLTNGRELQLFNTFIKRDLSAKRVMRLDLLAFNDSPEFQAIFDQLWHLSYERMTVPSEMQTWMQQQRLDSTMRQVLVNPASSAIEALVGQLGEAEINATQYDLVHWFSSILSTSLPVCWPKALISSKIAQPVALKKTPTAHKPPLSAEKGRLYPLIAAGLIEPGTKLVLIRSDQVVLEAIADSEGFIVYNGTQFKSPSDKVFVNAMGRQALNGWTAWYVDTSAGRRVINELRLELPAEVKEDLA